MKMSHAIVGSLVATGVTVGAVVWWQRRRPAVIPAPPPIAPPAASPTPAPPGGVQPYPTPAPPPGQGGAVFVPPKPGPITWDNAAPLPLEGEVVGDMSSNWGATPKELRPLLLLVEQASGIAGAARILAVIAKRESNFKSDAHNLGEDQAERNASYRAYQARKDNNPPLMHGDAAADFGSGGLFGALAPYFLWTGVAELGDKAPLLNVRPEIMFLPRVAAFAAAVYLQRLLAKYELKDHGDIKVGWGSIDVLTKRSEPTYSKIRERFFEDAKSLGIDLADTTTIPAKLSADKWPGVAAVFAQIVGTLPTPRGTP